jgi:PD-(D/E)XK endonuclease
MRALGLSGTSAGAIRVVRRHTTRLGLDVSHFRGKRRWSDAQLKNAVAESQSWDEVVEALGLSTNSGNARIHVKGHVIRLGIDFGHLVSREPAAPVRVQITPDLAHLREAGPSIASAWFTICGCSVLFPIEPAIYDLVVSMPAGLSRIQVKTTTSKHADGWQVGIGRHPHSIEKGGPRVPYDPDAIDYFFIVDGDLTMYLIPSRVIAGRVVLTLRTYKSYIVGSSAGLLGVLGVGDGDVQPGAVERASA